MRARLSVALLVCLTAAAPAAQSPSSDQSQPRPTFRGGVNYVRVDMYASTRDGQPITDLKADEIELFEDSVRQQIEDFQHVQIAPSPESARLEPNTVQQSRDMAADGRARVFVIFLDTYHTTIEGSANMRIPLIRFLDRVLGPDDMVAVMTPEMGASDITFGRKTTVISNIMQREWTWGRRNRIGPIDPKEELYEACYSAPAERQLVQEMKARRREKLSIDALEDLVRFLQGVRDERKAIVTVSEGWILYSRNPNLAALQKDRGAPLPNPFDKLRREPRTPNASTGNERVECEADRLALSELDDVQRIREVTEAANRGNVTFYPVYPRGLTAFDSDIGPDAPPTNVQDGVNLRSRHDSLRALAQDTDGTAIINTNDIERGMKRIADDLSSYYLFGYNSTNTKLDGKFRAITVRVKRPGSQVRARRGYRALTPEEVMNRSDGGAPGSPPAPAAVAVNPRAAFRLRSSTWTADNGGKGQGRVWLVGEMDFATRRDLAWSSGATAEISVVSGTGERVASMEVPFTATDGAFTLQLPAETPIVAGDYAVRARVVPRAGQALPLTDLVRVVVPPGTMALGEAVMLRRGGSTGPRFVATADPRFQRSDRLRLELPTRLDGTASARLLDRTGKPLQVPVMLSERRDESGNFRWVVADVVLAPLAPADYALEVTLGDAKQVTPFRLVS